MYIPTFNNLDKWNFWQDYIRDTEHKSEYIKFLTKYSNGVERPMIELPVNTIIKQYIMILKNEYYF